MIFDIDFQIKIFDCVIARRRMTYTTSSLCLAKIIIWKSIDNRGRFAGKLRNRVPQRCSGGRRRREAVIWLVVVLQCRANGIRDGLQELFVVGIEVALRCDNFLDIDFKIMILARQSEEVVYVIRRRAISQSKIFIWKSIITGFPGDY